jgi:hypothetical protein
MSRVVGLHGHYHTRDVPVNRGGVGVIYPLMDPAFVFKRYVSRANAPSFENVKRLVEIGQDVLLGQRKAPGDTPESSINWPIDVVLDGGGRAPSGVILPAIPRSLMNEFGKPRSLEFLVLARTNPPTAKARVVLLLRMAEIQAYLDALGLVHGDINAKNLAWTLQPRPIVYLIDCDGIVPQVPPPQSGVHALGWVDPRVVERVVPAPDHLSDRYALALAMYRGLLLVSGQLKRRADGVWPGPSQIPSGMPQRIRELLERGLQPLDGELRPTPADWVSTLSDTYFPAAKYDEPALAKLEQFAKPGRAAAKRRSSPVPIRFRRIPKADFAPGRGSSRGWTTTTGPHLRASPSSNPHPRRPPAPPPPRQRTPPPAPSHRPTPPPRQRTPPGPNERRAKAKRVLGLFVLAAACAFLAWALADSGDTGRTEPATPLTTAPAARFVRVVASDCRHNSGFSPTGTCGSDATGHGSYVYPRVSQFIGRRRPRLAGLR